MGIRIQHKRLIILISGVIALAQAVWPAHVIERSDKATFTAPAAASSETPGLVTFPPPAAPGTTAAGKEPYQVAQETMSTFQFVDTPIHFSLGPAPIYANERHDNGIAIGLRYRISPSPWDPATEFPWYIGRFPVALSLEAGSLVPHGTSVLKGEQRSVAAAGGGNTQFRVEERLPYEAHLGLIDELPHGRQNFVYPELGLGVSMAGIETMASAVTLATSGISTSYAANDATERKLSPWIMAGLHFFPTRFYSATIGGALFHYGNQLNFQGQSFNTSLTGWILLPMLQVQIVWPSHVHVALTPKRLPPWLMPAYTTEEISPWVAAPEVAQDPRWNKPGEPFGNVMFQYESRYVDKVELIGDFNDWEPEPMIKDRGGYWVTVKDLLPGRHLYNYVINGKREIKDPWNKSFDPDNRTRGSSIVVVPGLSK